MTGAGRDRQRGFVLLNALVLVLAMSAMAGGLLALAVRGTARLAALQEANQATQYLESGEVLVSQVLEQDWQDSTSVDHLGELWAVEDYAVPIDRGVLAGQIEDLQGRFNINWLTDADDLVARRAFDRLMSDLGLELQLAHSVAEFMRPGGPANPTPYINRDFPVRPTGGRIVLTTELRAIPGMTQSAFERLAPYLSALPPETALNVNTASEPVLSAMLPAAGEYDIAEIVRHREAEPFESVGSFVEIATRMARPDLFDDVGSDRFSVRSNWFVARLEVMLDGPARRRLIFLHRSNQSGDVTRRFRLDLP